MDGKPELTASPPPSAPVKPSPPPVRLSKRLKHLAEYAGLRAVTTPISLLPRAQALAVGSAIGRLIDTFMPNRARIGTANLRACLPDLSETQARQIVRKCWENLGAGAAEFTQLPRMSKEEIEAAAEIEGLELLKESYRKGKGALIITAHFGAWEIGGRVWPQCGFETAVVARRIKNPWVNDWVTRVRESGGVKVFLARDAFRESLRWLKQGKLLAILVDHRIPDGISVPFFGRPALTTPLHAVLGLRYGVPVHPVHCWREGGRVKVHIAPAMDFTGLSPTESGIAEATLRMNSVVESWIRERPEAWLWIHNRWKVS